MRARYWRRPSFRLSKKASWCAYFMRLVRPFRGKSARDSTPSDLSVSFNATKSLYLLRTPKIRPLSFVTVML